MLFACHDLVMPLKIDVAAEGVAAFTGNQVDADAAARRPRRRPRWSRRRLPGPWRSCRTPRSCVPRIQPTSRPSTWVVFSRPSLPRVRTYCCTIVEFIPPTIGAVILRPGTTAPTVAVVRLVGNWSSTSRAEHLPLRRLLHVDDAASRPRP